ncbi:MAG TPA: GNAT family N-acetyltransferase [Candidatus Tectomicrobia bacterium]|nr:GNAT family N-acetyltransferase [Candidatus Tectomicrobia bacterium]
MSSAPKAPLAFECHALSADRWRDLETLFGPRGAAGGCWCMYWRLPRAQFTAQKGEGNKHALRHLVESGAIVGLLAYAQGQPVGWCAIAPRESYPVLERSRILKRVDKTSVWSVVCFFVSKAFRGKGVTTALLRAAVDHASQQGARVIEGYPIEPKRGRMPDIFAWTGLASAFRQAGFVEVQRRSETRPIVRYTVQNH